MLRTDLQIVHQLGSESKCSSNCQAGFLFMPDPNMYCCLSSASSIAGCTKMQQSKGRAGEGGGG